MVRGIYAEALLCRSCACSIDAAAMQNHYNQVRGDDKLSVLTDEIREVKNVMIDNIGNARMMSVVIVWLTCTASAYRHSLSSFWCRYV